jgi:4-hydroxybenzoate polyprenyltransferase
MVRLFGSVFFSTHPIPSLAVTSFAVLYGASIGLNLLQLGGVGLAVLVQQFSVGLSNDWLDQMRDRSVERQDKPVALGLVPAQLVRNLAFVFATIALALGFSFGVYSGVVMVVMLAAGWSYNLGLKASFVSVLPYAVGFGILPSFVTLSASDAYLPEPWVFTVGALLGISAHFANALPDLVDDRKTGIHNLPEVLGHQASGLIISISAVAASGIVVLQSGTLNPLVGLIGFSLTVLFSVYAAILSFRVPAPRVLFLVIVGVSLINVLLLVLGSD